MTPTQRREQVERAPSVIIFKAITLPLAYLFIVPIMLIGLVINVVWTVVSIIVVGIMALLRLLFTGGFE